VSNQIIYKALKTRLKVNLQYGWRSVVSMLQVPVWLVSWV